MADRYIAGSALGPEDTEILITDGLPEQQKQAPAPLASSASSQRRPGGGSALALRAQFQTPSTNLLQQTVTESATSASSTVSAAQAVHPQAFVASGFGDQVASTSAAASTQQDPPPAQAFEGEGFQETGTSRKATADEFDDEFDYAFTGEQRQGSVHKQVFKPKAMPAHLLTNVKQGLLHERVEEGEEEEEEEEGEPLLEEGNEEEESMEDKGEETDYTGGLEKFAYAGHAQLLGTLDLSSKPPQPPSQKKVPLTVPPPDRMDSLLSLEDSDMQALQHQGASAANAAAPGHGSGLMDSQSMVVDEVTLEELAQVGSKAVPAQGRSLSQIVADAAADAVQRDGDREGSGETEGSGSGHLVSLPVDTVPHQRRQRSLSATSAPAGRPASAAAGGHKGVAFIKPGATYVEDLASLAEEVGSLLEGSAPTSFEVNADANAASVLLHQLQEQYASYDPGKQEMSHAIPSGWTALAPSELLGASHSNLLGGAASEESLIVDETPAPAGAAAAAAEGVAQPGAPRLPTPLNLHGQKQEQELINTVMSTIQEDLPSYKLLKTLSHDEMKLDQAMAAGAAGSVPSRAAGISASGSGVFLPPSSLPGSGNLTPASALAGQSPPAGSAPPGASPDAKGSPLAHTRVVSGFIAASSSGQPSGAASLPSHLHGLNSTGMPVTSMSSNSTAASQSVSAGVTESSAAAGQKDWHYVRSASEGAGLDSMSRARSGVPGNVRGSADILSTAGNTSPLTFMQGLSFDVALARLQESAPAAAGQTSSASGQRSPLTSPSNPSKLRQSTDNVPGSLLGTATAIQLQSASKNSPLQPATPGDQSGQQQGQDTLGMTDLSAGAAASAVAAAGAAAMAALDTNTECLRSVLQAPSVTSAGTSPPGGAGVGVGGTSTSANIAGLSLPGLTRATSASSPLPPASVQYQSSGAQVANLLLNTGISSSTNTGTTSRPSAGASAIASLMSSSTLGLPAGALSFGHAPHSPVPGTAIAALLQSSHHPPGSVSNASHASYSAGLGAPVGAPPAVPGGTTSNPQYLSLASGRHSLHIVPGPVSGGSSGVIPPLRSVPAPGQAAGSAQAPVFSAPAVGPGQVYQGIPEGEDAFFIQQSPASTTDTSTAPTAGTAVTSAGRPPLPSAFRAEQQAQAGVTAASGNTTGGHSSGASGNTHGGTGPAMLRTATGPLPSNLLNTGGSNIPTPMTTASYVTIRSSIPAAPSSVTSERTSELLTSFEELQALASQQRPVFSGTSPSIFRRESEGTGVHSGNASGSRSGIPSTQNPHLPPLPHHQRGTGAGSQQGSQGSVLLLNPGVGGNSSSQASIGNDSGGTPAGSLGQPATLQPPPAHTSSLTRGAHQLPLSPQPPSPMGASAHPPPLPPSAAILMSTAASAALEAEFEAANKRREEELQLRGAQARVSLGQAPFTELSTSPETGGPYHTALVHLMATPVDPDVRAAAEKLVVPAPTGLFAKLLCMGPPEMRPMLAEQQVRLLCLAKMPFSDQDPTHFQLLSSLYGAYTGKHGVEPSRRGSHWQELGFQGDDPATDLRGCGMLGLLQLAYLHQHNPGNAGRLYSLSRSGANEFPLSIVSLNATKFVLQALREGRLNGVANTYGSMVEAANRMHVGAMYWFGQAWARGNKTMAESGFVIKELEQRCRKQASALAQAASAPLKL